VTALSDSFKYSLATKFSISTLSGVTSIAHILQPGNFEGKVV
jgi:hypothetical protein